MLYTPSTSFVELNLRIYNLTNIFLIDILPNGKSACFNTADRSKIIHFKKYSGKIEESVFSG